MDYLDIYYKKNDLDNIINAATKQMVPDLKAPDKIVSVYYDTCETEEGATDFDDTYHKLINQTRFYTKEKKVVFVDQEFIYVIPFSKIVDYSIVLPNENNRSVYSTTTQITKTDTGDMVKRAIIGGVVGGGIGAIIGGSTAKTVTEENNFDKFYQALASKPLLELHLKFDNIVTPLIKINFDTDKEKIQEVAATLDVIVKRNAANCNTNDDKNDEVIKQKYNISEVGDNLGIPSINPYSKYDEDSTGWDSESICGCLIMIAILAGLFYMCS